MKTLTFRALALGGIALVALASAACMPPTETPALTNPPAGCYDNTANTSQADYTYTGTPNVLHNMKGHGLPADGSCTGPLASPLDATLILAADQPTANSLCLAAGGTGVGVGNTWYSQGWLTLPTTAWACTG
jgi:hypothetical protein